MRPLLLISYFFPPLGMAGVGRAWGLFRYLPHYGYQPYVLTVKPIAYPAYDNSLLVAADEKFITRTNSLDPSRLLYLAGVRKSVAPNRTGILSRLATPDFKIWWTPFARRAALRLIDKYEIRYVVTTSPPPSIHSLGLWLKQRRRIHWVADFRDMWVTRPIETAYLRGSQRKYSRQLLSQIQSGADRVVAVNASVAKYVGASLAIANATESSFAPLWQTTASPDQILRIGYLGTTDSVATIRPFVTALTSALNQASISPQRVRLIFVGSCDESILRTECAAVGLEDSLEIITYLPRSQAIARLAAADILLATLPDDGLTHVTGSKIFDYLISGKQILAIAPRDSELGVLVETAGHTCIAPSDFVNLEKFLHEALIRKQRRETHHVALHADALEKYSYQSMARAFARELDAL